MRGTGSLILSLIHEGKEGFILATLKKHNYLIIGASSPVARYFVDNHDQEKYNFYGVSSKIDKPTLHKNLHLFSLYRPSDLADIEFHKMLILSSRLLSENVSLSDFREVNFHVMRLLKALKFSPSHTLRIMFMSTFSVYNPLVKVITEQTPTELTNDYVISKLELEDLLNQFSRDINALLLILRMPIFAYPGVADNFLARLVLATRNGEEFTLTNPNSTLSAVFDIDNLIALGERDWLEHKIVNCASAGDITFQEIAEFALSKGLQKATWRNTDRPSQKVSLDVIEKILGYKPSAKAIVTNLFAKEFS